MAGGSTNSNLIACHRIVELANTIALTAIVIRVALTILAVSAVMTVLALHLVYPAPVWSRYRLGFCVLLVLLLLLCPVWGVRSCLEWLRWRSSITDALAGSNTKSLDVRVTVRRFGAVAHEEIVEFFDDSLANRRFPESKVLGKVVGRIPFGHQLPAIVYMDGSDRWRPLVVKTQDPYQGLILLQPAPWWLLSPGQLSV